MRFSKDVLALNPILQDATVRRAASGQPEDCADLLLTHMRLHAPDLALRFVRDYPFDRWKIDLAIPSVLLGIEVNGGYSHARGGKHGTNKDHRKIRMITLAGWRVFVFAANEVRVGPLDVIAEIREILGEAR